MTKKKKTGSSGVPKIQAVNPPSTMKTWHAFAWLIVTAIALHYAKWPILVFAAVVFFAVGAAWFGNRFPYTTIFLLGFLRGLTGRGRWRRW